jgi:hypothetical protein
MNEGLYLAGTVTGRTKRMVGKDLNTELVTYKIDAANKVFYLKDWEPKGDYYIIGEVINVPVSVKPYLSKGQTLLDFSIYKGSKKFGEEF